MLANCAMPLIIKINLFTKKVILIKFSICQYISGLALEIKKMPFYFIKKLKTYVKNVSELCE
jgi:hypothetical protein